MATTWGVLECRVLGPLQVDRGGVEVSVAGQVAGRVLAALSTTAGVPMDDEVLAEVVWGDQLPGQIGHSLRVVVSRLRGKLGTDRVQPGDTLEESLRELLYLVLSTPEYQLG